MQPPPSDRDAFAELCSQFYFDRDATAGDALSILFQAAANLPSGAGFTQVASFPSDLPAAARLKAAVPSFCFPLASKELGLFLSSNIFASTEAIKLRVRKASQLAEGRTKLHVLDAAIKECLAFRDSPSIPAEAATSPPQQAQSAQLVRLRDFAAAASDPSRAAILLRTILLSLSSSGRSNPQLKGSSDPLLSSLALLLENGLSTEGDDSSSCLLIEDEAFTEAAGGLAVIPRQPTDVVLAAENNANASAVWFLRDLIAFLILTLGIDVATATEGSGFGIERGHLRMWRLPPSTRLLSLTRLTLLLTCPLPRPGRTLAVRGKEKETPSAVSTLPPPPPPPPGKEIANGQEALPPTSTSMLDAAADSLYRQIFRLDGSPSGGRGGEPLAAATFASLQGAAAAWSRANTIEASRTSSSPAGSSLLSGVLNAFAPPTLSVALVAEPRPDGVGALFSVGDSAANQQWLATVEKELEALVSSSTVGPQQKASIATLQTLLKQVRESGDFGRLRQPKDESLCAPGLLFTAHGASGPPPPSSDHTFLASLRLLPSFSVDPAEHLPWRTRPSDPLLSISAPASASSSPADVLVEGGGDAAIAVSGALATGDNDALTFPLLTVASPFGRNTPAAASRKKGWHCVML